MSKQRPKGRKIWLYIINYSKICIDAISVEELKSIFFFKLIPERFFYQKI